MTEQEVTFEHIRAFFRSKIVSDLQAHITGDGKWNYDKFDGANDYQRHLYALFLKQAGIPYEAIWAKVVSLATDVPASRREQYADDVLHSEVVGFKRKDGSLLLLPAQEIGG